MGPPLLRPALYGTDVVGVPTFSAFIYGYIDEICDRQTLLTKERLVEMIYRAKYVNPDTCIPQPTCKSGVLIRTEGYTEGDAQGKIQDVETAIKKLPETLVRSRQNKR